MSQSSGSSHARLRGCEHDSKYAYVGVAPSAASRSPLGLRSAAFRRCPWIRSTATRTDETLNTLFPSERSRCAAVVAT